MGNNLEKFVEDGEKKEDEDTTEIKIDEPGGTIVTKINEDLQGIVSKEIRRFTRMNKGEFSNAGINYGLGKIKFELKYDVKEENLILKLFEADGLHCYSSLHSNLYSYVEVSLTRKSEQYFEFKSESNVPNYLKPSKDEHELGNIFRKSLVSKTSKLKKQLKKPLNLGEHKSSTDTAYLNNEFSFRQYLPIMRSSICCGSLSPIWRDTFVYRNIRNVDLKDLVLKLTVIDLGRSTCVKPVSKDEIMKLGEFVYELEKMYKPLTKEKGDPRDNDSSEINGEPTKIKVDTLQYETIKVKEIEADRKHSTTSHKSVVDKEFVSPHPGITPRKSQAINLVKGEDTENVNNDGDVFEEEKEIDNTNYTLPTMVHERGLNFVENWMNANEMLGYWPKPNIEYGGLLNDNELKDILIRERENDPKPKLDFDNDSDIRDSISIRFMINYMKKKSIIKESPPKKEIKSSLSDEEKVDEKPSIPGYLSTKQRRFNLDLRPEKEKHLSYSERPKLYRYVGGWKYLTMVDGNSKVRGELEIGLTYNPEHNQILFQIIQARNIKDDSNLTMPISVDFQARLRKYVKSATDPRLVLSEEEIDKHTHEKKKKNSKFNLMRHHHEHVHSTESLTKALSTETRNYTNDPVWNKSFVIDVGQNVINNIVFDLHIMSEDTLIGCMRLFNNKLNPIMEDQWNAMLKKTRFPSVRWYPISL